MEQDLTISRFSDKMGKTAKSASKKQTANE